MVDRLLYDGVWETAPHQLYKDKMNNDERRKNPDLRREVKFYRIALMVETAFILVLLYVISKL